MKVTFYIAPDIVSFNGSRAYKYYPNPQFDKINHAIAALKRQTRPYKLVFRESNGTERSIMYWEGSDDSPFYKYTDKKKRGLLKVGERTWVPKLFVRKTNRKLKKRCGDSKLLTIQPSTYPKSTPRGSSSRW